MNIFKGKLDLDSHKNDKVALRSAELTSCYKGLWKPDSYVMR